MTLQTSNSKLKKAPKSALSRTPDFWAHSSIHQWESDPINSFISWLSQLRVLGYRSLRASSFETYLAIFTVWERFLREQHLTLLEASSSDAEMFFKQANLEPTSRRRYLQLLDKVYFQLTMIGFKGENPLKQELLKEDMLDESFPPGLTKEELSKLVALLREAKGWKGARDRALVALTAGAGLRISELINLRLEAIQSNWTVAIPSVNIHNPHGSLILPENIIASTLTPWRAWVEEWGAIKRAEKIPGGLAIPSTRSGGHYSRSGVFRRVKGLFAQANIKAPQNGANILRNTFARTALESGKYSIQDVQEFMGHENLRATERYL